VTIRLSDAPFDVQGHVPPGLELKPPFRFEDVQAFIEHDPAEGEALVSLIRQLRKDD
jgi:hypothetical protein